MLILYKIPLLSYSYQQDLVAWVTLGSFHIPRTEDVPITTTPGNGLHFFILPYNFFPEDPSLASRDNIRVTPDGDSHNYEYAGVEKEVTCVPRGVSLNECHQSSAAGPVAPYMKYGMVYTMVMLVLVMYTTDV